MPFPPALASALAALALPAAERERLGGLHFHDAGHGYDPFGMQPLQCFVMPEQLRCINFGL